MEAPTLTANTGEGIVVAPAAPVVSRGSKKPRLATVFLEVSWTVSVLRENGTFLDPSGRTTWGAS